MGNAVFLYDTQADEALLSGGAWSGALHLANVQSRRYERVARSTSTALVSTIVRASLSREVPIRGVAAIVPNATLDAQFRVSAHANGSFASPVYSSGWISVTDESEWIDEDRAPILSVAFDEIESRFW